MISVVMIDSSIEAAGKLTRLLNEYEFISISGVFTDPNRAIQDFQNEPPDAVLMDTDYPNSDGMEYAKYIREQFPKTDLIFTASSGHNAVTAFEINAIDYIVKPIAQSRLHNTIMRLWNQHCNKIQSPVKKPNIKIQCFGKFEILKGDKHPEEMKWRTKKVKELMAYLLCRYEKTISKDELAMLLFNGEDKKKAQNNLYVTMSYLRKQLFEFQIPRNMLLLKGDYTLQIESGVCDFVDFDRFLSSNIILDEDNIDEMEKKLRLYKGMYLEEEDYIWAYEIRHYLDKKYEDTLMSMGDYYKENRKLKNSEKAYSRILTNNPFSIDAYTKLLDLYIELNKPDRFTRTFQRFSEFLKEEYEEIPSHKYREYFIKVN